MARHIAHITAWNNPKADQVNGLRTSNEAFLRALLEFGSFEKLDLILPEPQIKPFEATWKDFLDKTNTAGKINLHRVWDIPHKIKEGLWDIVILGDPLIDPIVNLRHALSPKLFPVTGITHSLHMYGQSDRSTQTLLSRTLPCDRIFCSSVAGKNVLQKAFEHQSAFLKNRFASTAPIHTPGLEVIPLGVEFPQSTGLKKEALRENLGLPVKDPLILCNGRICINTKMDHIPLLLALREIIQKPGLENTRLLLSGSTWLESSYLKALNFRITQLGLDHHVLFKLNYDNNIKASLYEAADIVISLPDNTQETFGISPVEAMFLKKPVILSDWNGHAELIEDGIEGYKIPTYWGQGDSIVDLTAVCSPAQSLFYAAQSVAIDIPILINRIEKLLRDKNLCHEMGQAGHARAQKLFRWDTIIKAYEASWNQMLLEAQSLPWEKDRSEKLDSPSLYELFGHYAKHSLTPETKFLRTPYGERVSNRQETLSLYPSVLSWIDSTGVFEVLQATSDPASAEDLAKMLSHSQGVTLYLLLWMVKNGLLEISSL